MDDERARSNKRHPGSRSTSDDVHAYEQWSKRARHEERLDSYQTTHYSRSAACGKQDEANEYRHRSSSSHQYPEEYEGGEYEEEEYEPTYHQRSHSVGTYRGPSATSSSQSGPPERYGMPPSRLGHTSTQAQGRGQPRFQGRPVTQSTPPERYPKPPGIASSQVHGRGLPRAPGPPTTQSRPPERYGIQPNRFGVASSQGQRLGLLRAAAPSATQMGPPERYGVPPNRLCQISPQVQNREVPRAQGSTQSEPKERCGIPPGRHTFSQAPPRELPRAQEDPPTQRRYPDRYEIPPSHVQSREQARAPSLDDSRRPYSQASTRDASVNPAIRDRPEEQVIGGTVTKLFAAYKQLKGTLSSFQEEPPARRPFARARSPPPSARSAEISAGEVRDLRSFVGKVTVLRGNYGIVDDECFFDTSALDGNRPEMHELVQVLAAPTPNEAFPWKAKAVTRLPETLRSSGTKASSSVRTDRPVRPQQPVAIGGYVDYGHKKPTEKSVGDLFDEPGRLSRPKKFVVLVRGLPGSGKSHFSTYLKEKELKHGGQPGVLSIDELFMVTSVIKAPCFVTKKIIKKTVTEYEYDADLDEAFQGSLLRSFHSKLKESDVIIVDAIFDKVAYLRKFWDSAKDAGFEVYVAEMMHDAQLCSKLNTHKRSLREIETIKENWEDLPETMIKFGLSPYLEEYCSAINKMLKLTGDEALEPRGNVAQPKGRPEPSKKCVSPSRDRKPRRSSESRKKSISPPRDRKSSRYVESRKRNVSPPSRERKSSRSYATPFSPERAPQKEVRKVEVRQIEEPHIEVRNYQHGSETNPSPVSTMPPASTQGLGILMPQLSTFPQQMGMSAMQQPMAMSMGMPGLPGMGMPGMRMPIQGPPMQRSPYGGVMFMPNAPHPGYSGPRMQPRMPGSGMVVPNLPPQQIPVAQVPQTEVNAKEKSNVLELKNLPGFLQKHTLIIITGNETVDIDMNLKNGLNDAVVVMSSVKAAAEAMARILEQRGRLFPPNVTCQYSSVKSTEADTESTAKEKKPLQNRWVGIRNFRFGTSVGQFYELLGRFNLEQVNIANNSPGNGCALASVRFKDAGSMQKAVKTIQGIEWNGLHIDVTVRGPVTEGAEGEEGSGSEDDEMMSKMRASAKKKQQNIKVPFWLLKAIREKRVLRLENFRYTTSKVQIVKFFARYGVEKVEILIKHPSQGRALALISLRTPSDVALAIKKVTNYVWNGYPLKVSAEHVVREKEGGASDKAQFVDWSCDPSSMEASKKSLKNKLPQARDVGLFQKEVKERRVIRVFFIPRKKTEKDFRNLIKDFAVEDMKFFRGIIPRDQSQALIVTQNLREARRLCRFLTTRKNKNMKLFVCFEISIESASNSDAQPDTQPVASASDQSEKRLSECIGDDSDPETTETADPEAETEQEKYQCRHTKRVACEPHMYCYECCLVRNQQVHTPDYTCGRCKDLDFIHWKQIMEDRARIDRNSNTTVIAKFKPGVNKDLVKQVLQPSGVDQVTCFTNVDIEIVELHMKSLKDARSLQRRLMGSEEPRQKAGIILKFRKPECARALVHEMFSKFVGLVSGPLGEVERTVHIENCHSKFFDAHVLPAFKHTRTWIHGTPHMGGEMTVEFDSALSAKAFIYLVNGRCLAGFVISAKFVTQCQYGGGKKQKLMKPIVRSALGPMPMNGLVDSTLIVADIPDISVEEIIRVFRVHFPNATHIRTEQLYRSACVVFDSTAKVAAYSKYCTGEKELKIGDHPVIVMHADHSKRNSKSVECDRVLRIRLPLGICLKKTLAAIFPSATEINIELGRFGITQRSITAVFASELESLKALYAARGATVDGKPISVRHPFYQDIDESSYLIAGLPSDIRVNEEILNAMPDAVCVHFPEEQPPELKRLCFVCFQDTGKKPTELYFDGDAYKIVSTYKRAFTNPKKPKQICHHLSKSRDWCFYDETETQGGRLEQFNILESKKAKVKGQAKKRPVRCPVCDSNETNSTVINEETTQHLIEKHMPRALSCVNKCELCGDTVVKAMEMMCRFVDQPSFDELLDFCLEKKIMTGELYQSLLLNEQEWVFKMKDVLGQTGYTSTSYGAKSLYRSVLLNWSVMYKLLRLVNPVQTYSFFVFGSTDTCQSSIVQKYNGKKTCIVCAEGITELNVTHSHLDHLPKCFYCKENCETCVKNRVKSLHTLCDLLGLADLDELLELCREQFMYPTAQTDIDLCETTKNTSYFTELCKLLSVEDKNPTICPPSSTAVLADKSIVALILSTVARKEEFLPETEEVFSCAMNRHTGFLIRSNQAEDALAFVDVGNYSHIRKYLFFSKGKNDICKLCNEKVRDMESKGHFKRHHLPKVFRCAQHCTTCTIQVLRFLEAVAEAYHVPDVKYLYVLCLLYEFYGGTNVMDSCVARAADELADSDNLLVEKLAQLLHAPNTHVHLDPPNHPAALAHWSIIRYFLWALPKPKYEAFISATKHIYANPGCGDLQPEISNIVMSVDMSGQHSGKRHVVVELDDKSDDEQASKSDVICIDESKDSDQDEPMEEAIESKEAPPRSSTDNLSFKTVTKGIPIEEIECAEIMEINMTDDADKDNLSSPVVISLESVEDETNADTDVTGVSDEHRTTPSIVRSHSCAKEQLLHSVNEPNSKAKDFEVIDKTEHEKILDSDEHTLTSDKCSEVVDEIKSESSTVTEIKHSDVEVDTGSIADNHQSCIADTSAVSAHVDQALGMGDVEMTVATGDDRIPVDESAILSNNSVIPVAEVKGESPDDKEILSQADLKCNVRENNREEKYVVLANVEPTLDTEDGKIVDTIEGEQMHHIKCESNTVAKMKHSVVEGASSVSVDPALEIGDVEMTDTTEDEQIKFPDFPRFSNDAPVAEDNGETLEDKEIRSHTDNEGAELLSSANEQPAVSANVEPISDNEIAELLSNIVAQPAVSANVEPISDNEIAELLSSTDEQPAVSATVEPISDNKGEDTTGTIVGEKVQDAGSNECNIIAESGEQTEQSDKRVVDCENVDMKATDDDGSSAQNEETHKALE